MHVILIYLIYEYDKIIQKVYELKYKCNLIIKNKFCIYFPFIFERILLNSLFKQSLFIWFKLTNRRLDFSKVIDAINNYWQ